MANETTSTTLNDLIQAAIAEATLTQSQGADLTQTVRTMDVPRGKSGVIFPDFDSETAATVAEGTDLSNTAFSTGGSTISCGEVGVQLTLTDVADWQSQPANVGAQLGEVARDAINSEKTQAIYALLGGFSTAIGSSNTNITEALILQGARTLKGARAPKPFYLVCTPHVAEDVSSLYATSTSVTSEQIRRLVLDEGQLPPIHGVTLLEVDNLAPGSGSGGIDEADTNTGIYSPGAIGLALGYDLRIEQERDASLRASELVFTSFYGVGEIKDSYGVELLVDNAD